MGSKYAKRHTAFTESVLRENALLNPVKLDRFASETFRSIREFALGNRPEFEALALAMQAEEAEDPAEQTRLANEAVRLDPECVKAYQVLASACESPQEALPYCEQAVAAGERLLRDLGVNLEEDGVLTGSDVAFGYLQSRSLLARCLIALKRVEEGFPHYPALLRLDHDDTVGARYQIVLLALTGGKLEILDNFLKVYEWDRSGGWLFVRVLHEFKRGGDSWPARKALKRANSKNPYIEKILLDPDYQPRADWEEGPDADDIVEATVYCLDFGPLWIGTEGALDWLASH